MQKNSLIGNVFFEKLAAIEHERWADWQKYLHSKCIRESTGLLIPATLVKQWERQIATPYAELSEKEKESDREQVLRYWPLISDDDLPPGAELIAETVLSEKEFHVATWHPSDMHCPGCDAILAWVDRLNDMGEPPNRVLECAACQVHYRMPTIDLEVIPRNEGLVEPEPFKPDFRCLCPECGVYGGAPADFKRGDKIKCWQCGETVHPKFDPELHDKLNV